MTINNPKTKIWMQQIRANFLLLSVLLVALGLSIARWQHGYEIISLWESLLLLAGVVLAHISVNLFNEHSDNKTGIDYNTERTPFSGGSGMLQAGHTMPREVLAASWITLLLALAIGVYFCLTSHWILIFIVLAGGIIVVTYTTHLNRWLIGETAAGLGLGTFVILGVYTAATSTWQTPTAQVIPLPVLIASLPSGILTGLLLLLNEFPDAEADRKGGRFHLVIFLGYKKAAYLYTAFMAINYLIIISLPVFFNAGYWMLIALATMPLAAAASVTAIKHGDNIPKLTPALGMNVITVLATNALMALSFWL